MTKNGVKKYGNKIKNFYKLIKFYQDDLSIKQLKEYFDNNVIWKDK